MSPCNDSNPPLVAEVTAMYCGTVVDVRHIGQGRHESAYTIGQGHDVSLPVPLPYPSFPLVSHDERGFVLCASSEMDATISRDGETGPPRHTTVRLERGSRATVAFDELRFEVRLVDAATLDVGRNDADWPLLAAIAVTAAVVLTFIGLLLAVPDTPEFAELEPGPKQARFARYMNEPAPEPPPQRRRPEVPKQHLAKAKPTKAPKSKARVVRPSAAPAGDPSSKSKPTRARGLRRPDAWQDPDGEPTYEDSVFDRDFNPLERARGAGVLGGLAEEPPETILAAGTFDVSGADVDAAFAAWANSDVGSKGMGGLELTGEPVGGGTADGVIGSGSASAVEEPPTPPRERPVGRVSKVKIKGDLDQAAVDRVLRRHSGEMRTCLLRYERLPRVVTITIHLEPDGSVTVETSVGARGKAVGRCIEKAAEQWDFPRATSRTRIRYRFSTE